jgi:flavin-dependent dehydrogenase
LFLNKGRCCKRISVDDFGIKDLHPAPGLISVGDASAFIDPFTGSGMLMALEGAEILANSIKESNSSLAELELGYESLHKKRFQKRLWVCSALRHAAFVPSAAKLVISVLEFSKSAQEFLARATRRAQSDNQ